MKEVYIEIEQRVKSIKKVVHCRQCIHQVHQIRVYIFTQKLIKDIIIQEIIIGEITIKEITIKEI